MNSVIILREQNPQNFRQDVIAISLYSGAVHKL
jgi:hypothetical protein